MKRLHLALGVKNIEQSIKEYTQRLSAPPEIVVDNVYALFRTETLNLSIRKSSNDDLGLRHLGWESSEYTTFSEETDCNGYVWEHFNQKNQEDDIHKTWPASQYSQQR